MDIKNRKAPHRFQRGDETALLIDIKRDDYVIPGLLVESGARVGDFFDIDGRPVPSDAVVRLGFGPIDAVYQLLATAGWQPVESAEPAVIGATWGPMSSHVDASRLEALAQWGKATGAEA